MATRLRAQSVTLAQVWGLRVPPGACHRCAPPKRLTTKEARAERKEAPGTWHLAPGKKQKHRKAGETPCCLLPIKFAEFAA